MKKMIMIFGLMVAFLGFMTLSAGATMIDWGHLIFRHCNL